ncbi:hypothetical protein [Merismopedia glauca]
MTSTTGCPWLHEPSIFAKYGIPEEARPIRHTSQLLREPNTVR